MNVDNLWDNNEIQFMRLLAEINGAVEFTDEQMEALCASMDLDPPNIGELLERAQVQWDRYLEMKRKGACTACDWPCDCHDWRKK